MNVSPANMEFRVKATTRSTRGLAFAVNCSGRQ